MNSMTGFGYAESESAGIQISVEMKSVNARYLDLSIALSSTLSVFEGRIRDYLQKTFHRGRVELHAQVRDGKDVLTVSVDKAAAKAWELALKNLASFLDGEDQKISLDLIAQQDGVLTSERHQGAEIHWPFLESLLSSSAKQVLADREREGLRLGRDIESQLAIIEDALAHVLQRAPQIKAEVEKTLRVRFQEFLGDDADNARVLTEIAAWIAKIDINEEIVRLGAHIDAFREEAFAQGAKGKKLDFLSQEMVREINTIGAKTPRADISRQVVNMKDAAEKIREQLRNVE